MSLSFQVSQLKEVLISLIRCPYASYRMMGYSIIVVIQNSVDFIEMHALFS